jgi:ATPase subunit of ABC transporter with duplicated ATPase domains
VISTNNVSLSFGKRTLFDEVNINFTEGNCYGIIGANGAGKSTFMKILSGDIEPNKGSVSITPGQRLSFLRQDHYAFNEETVLNTVLMGNKDLFAIQQEKDALYMKEDFSEADGIKAGELEEKFGEMGGYTAESDAAQMLVNLGVKEEAHQSVMKDVAGEIKIKVLLAQALFGTPEILLLDEPTNDIDLKTVLWLEDFLADYPHIAIVVSHDRHFLDTVCTHVADVDKGKINTYTGNYTFWYESSQLAARQATDKNKKTEDKRKDLQDFIRRFSANASKSRQATSRKKALEKLVLEDIKPSNRRYPGIFFTPNRPVGNDILKVEKLSASIDGEILFSDVNFDMSKNDKILFVADDKRAVTTFFEIINDKIKADSGEYTWGTTITTAYLPVNNEEYFQKELNLLDWLHQYVPEGTQDVDEDFLRQFFGRMLFRGDEVNKMVPVLSGGEKVRCMVSRMMLMNPNVVILDEPTAHLDLESIQAFNNGCKDFPSNILMATHDQTFANTTCNRVIELRPDGMSDHIGTYEEYLEKKNAAVEA